jgi:hypothetical protein
MSLAVTVDNPNRNGRVTVQGYGKTWSCADPRDTGQRGGAGGWFLEPTVQYIPELGGIAPAGIVAPVDMDLGDWTVLKGGWQLGPGGGYLGVAPLHFYDGATGRIAANAYGQIASAAPWAPYLKVYLYRFPGSMDAEVPWFMIELVPAAGEPSYAILLPTDNQATGGGVDYLATLTGTGGGAYRGPLFLGQAYGEALWTVLDEIRTGQGGTLTARQPSYLEITVEVAGENTLLVRMGDADEAWSYRGDWRSLGGADVTWEPQASYTMQFTVAGQTAMIAAAPITYVLGGTARPASGIWVPSMIEPTAQYKLACYYADPIADHITVAQEGAHPLTRPRVTFEAAATVRSVLYSVQEYRDATIGDVDSNPVTSALGSLFEVNSASGELSNRYRDSRVTVEVCAPPGYVPNIVKTNCHLLVQSTPDEVSYYNHFWGRVTGQERIREDPLGRVVSRVEGADEWYRFGKKRMAWHCSYAGWPVDEAVQYILERFGIPNSLVTVHADVSALGMGDLYYLPLDVYGGRDPLQFDDEATGDEALEIILGLRDLELQALTDGTLYLRPRPVYTGTPDLLFDEDSMAGDELIIDARATSTPDEFINALLLVIGEGYTATSRLMWDTLSQSVNTSPDYIGDDWWYVQRVEDADELMPIARAIWARRYALSGTVYLHTGGNRQLMPGQYIRISNLTDLGLTADTDWEIKHKAWSEDAMSYKQVLELAPVVTG